MTRDDIILMAREACDPDKMNAWHNGFWTLTQDELERFFRAAYAAGVAAECQAIVSALTNPGNQPSQFGTVTIDYMEQQVGAEREACAREGWLAASIDCEDRVAAAICARGQE